MTGPGTTTDARPVRQRVDSVDFLRGTAMMALVLVHSVLYFTPLNTDVDLAYLVFGYLLGDTGAALFLTLVGISFALSRAARETSARSLADATIRGLFLFAVAVLVSVLTTGPDTIFEWDVLVLIAIASVALAFLRRVPSPALLLLATAIVAVAPWLRDSLGYLQWWGGTLMAVDGVQPPGLLVHPPDDFAPGLDLHAAAVGNIAAAWFPVFPWLAFPIIGLVLGRRLSGDRHRVSAQWLLLGLGFLASGLTVALTAVAQDRSDPVAQHWAPLSFTPDSTAMVLVQLGLVLLLLGLTHLLMDGPRPMGPWMNPIRLVSRYALTVYVLSYVAIFLVIHILDLVDPDAAHMYGVMPSAWAVVFGAGFVVLMTLVLRAWDRRGGVMTLEWILARLRVRAGRT
jgi:uncharacterized membrane protein